jgi:sigma-B regulation protein RsbU (phosphoserine phosphatase)
MRTRSLPNTHWHPELDYNAFCQCACDYRGNFYDFIPDGGSGLSVSFGDLPFAGEIQSINVPGFAALVRGLSAGIRDDLAGLACELNSVLHLLGPRDLCVPWFYARIDPAGRQLQYVNAGHEAPLLIRHGGIERLERTGAALGLSTRAVHRQKAIRIEAGDLLAIFSEAVSGDAVLGVVEESPQASTAELAQRVLEVSRRPGIGEDLTFAAVRMLSACRHPLVESRAELALCAA